MGAVLVRRLSPRIQLLVRVRCGSMLSLLAVAFAMPAASVTESSSTSTSSSSDDDSEANLRILLRCARCRRTGYLAEERELKRVVRVDCNGSYDYWIKDGKWNFECWPCLDLDEPPVHPNMRDRCAESLRLSLRDMLPAEHLRTIAEYLSANAP